MEIATIVAIGSIIISIVSAILQLGVWKSQAKKQNIEADVVKIDADLRANKQEFETMREINEMLRENLLELEERYEVICEKLKKKDEELSKFKKEKERKSDD